MDENDSESLDLIRFCNCSCSFLKNKGHIPSFYIITYQRRVFKLFFVVSLNFFTYLYYISVRYRKPAHIYKMFIFKAFF